MSCRLVFSEKTDPGPKSGLLEHEDGTKSFKFGNQSGAKSLSTVTRNVGMKVFWLLSLRCTHPDALNIDLSWGCCLCDLCSNPLISRELPSLASINFRLTTFTVALCKYPPHKEAFLSGETARSGSRTLSRRCCSIYRRTGAKRCIFREYFQLTLASFRTAPSLDRNSYGR